MDREEKARLYDRLLAEHDDKAREISLIKSKFDLTPADEKEISKLKKEMAEIQRKAEALTYE